MKRGTKIVLIVAGSVAIVIGLVAGGAWWWWRENSAQLVEAGKAAVLEGRKTGADLDEHGCVAQAVGRHGAEPAKLSLSTSIPNNLFLSACLHSSKASPGFCDGIPSDDEPVSSALWATRKCASLGFSDSYCPRLVGRIASYCSSTTRGKKLP